jgi:hypothetical protein
MSDRPPEFESTDRKGTTDVFVGSVGTSWTAIPTVATTEIQSFIVSNDAENPITETISISLDAGTTTMDLIYPTGSSYQLVKGALTQIWIKGSIASVDYKVVLNREQT